MTPLNQYSNSPSEASLVVSSAPASPPPGPLEEWFSPLSKFSPQERIRPKSVPLPICPKSYFPQVRPISVSEGNLRERPLDMRRVQEEAIQIARKCIEAAEKAGLIVQSSPAPIV